jgi:hypothetical protein
LGFSIRQANAIIPTIHKEYADDLTNIVSTQAEICPLIANNNNALKLIGSNLAPNKTEIIHISREGKEEIYEVKEGVTEITAESHFHDIFEKTEKKSVRILGDLLGPSLLAINMRLSLANVAFGKFYKSVWKRNNLTYKTKMKIFQASIISIMTYALKCHAANSKMLRKLDIFCLRKLKTIFRYDFDDKISYARMEAEMSFFDIRWEWPSTIVRKARVKYFIQLLRNEEFVQLLTPQPGEKRRIGRPRTRFVDVLIQDLDDLNLLRDGNDLYTFQDKIDSLPTTHYIRSQETAIKVLKLCEIYQKQILENM